MEGHAHGCRLICGSARDLEAEVRAGNLREDLYYRISGVCLRLPPLRQRREDIPVLMEHFLRKYGRDFQRAVPVLSEETQRLFEEYSWPGNVRELENAAKAIMALGDETIAMGGLRAVLRRTGGDNGGRVSLKQAARAASRGDGKRVDPAGADPDPLEPAPCRGRITDQLQGFALQAQADGMLRGPGIIRLSFECLTRVAGYRRP